jgi:hypothetical protein
MAKRWMVLLAACGGSAPAPRTPAVTTVSLERIERIARLCVQSPTEVYANATKTGDTWTSRVRIGDRDLVIDPVASTCDGAPIASSTERPDRSLDDVIAVARKCHQDAAGEILISYVVGMNTTPDRAHYLVSFVAPGPSRTFPLPAFVVDPVRKTCQPPAGPHM